MEGSLRLEQSRRPTRERRYTQDFGYTGSDSRAEELVSKTLKRLVSLMLVVLPFLDLPRSKFMAERQFRELLTEGRNEHP